MAGVAGALGAELLGQGDWYEAPKWVSASSPIQSLYIMQHWTSGEHSSTLSLKSWGIVVHNLAVIHHGVHPGLSLDMKTSFTFTTISLSYAL